jgi:hypothetical protein
VNDDICGSRGILDRYISHAFEKSGFVCSSQYTLILAELFYCRIMKVSGKFTK